MHKWHPLQVALHEKEPHSPLYIVDMEPYRLAILGVQPDRASIRTSRILFGTARRHTHGLDCAPRVIRVISHATLPLTFGRWRTVRFMRTNLIHRVAFITGRRGDWGQRRLTITELTELLPQTVQQRRATERAAH